MSCIRNDVLLYARAGAYSALICVVPIVLIVATMVAFAPGAEFVRGELRSMLYQMFPPDIPPLVLAYFQGEHHRSVQVVLSAIGVFILAANSVMMTLMKAMRRAYCIPDGQWSIPRQVMIAFILTFLSVVPLALASMFVVFGHQIEIWMNYQSAYDLRPYTLVLARLVRWSLAVATSITVLAIIYHLGTPRTQSWRRVLPGSMLATALWFPSTLLFGWYVTRHAHYHQVYGSLAAAIALLVWLYIFMVSVMVGAEFNAQLFPKHSREPSAIREGVLTQSGP